MKPRAWAPPPMTDRLGRIRGGRWRGRLAIPRHLHPLVRQLYEQANHQGALLSEIAARAGIAHATVKGWRRKSPQLVTFEAAANVLGYRLKLVAIDPSTDAARNG